MKKSTKETLNKVLAVITASSFLVSVLCGNVQAGIKTDIRQEQDRYFQSQKVAGVRVSPVVSETFGKVSDSTDNGSKTVVINIQDLHCDYTVQKNIYSVISELKNKYGIEKIYVEGGYGKIDLSLFEKIKEPYRENVIENLLKSGRLTGAEYYGLKSGNTDLLAGIEDKDVYASNIERLKMILADKNKNESVLNEIRKETEFLEAKYLGKKNRELNKIINKYYDGKITQETYFKKLLGYASAYDIKLENYPNMSAYLGLSDSSINYDRVRSELLASVDEIKKNISYEQYRTILKDTNNFKEINILKDITRQFFKSKNRNFAKAYPELNKYYDAKEKASEFNPGMIVKEEENIIDRIRINISGNENELEVAYLVGFEKYFKGYVIGSLTAAQWEYVKTGKDKYVELYGKYSVTDDIAKLTENFSLFDKFYSENNRRNEIFVNKINAYAGTSEKTNKDFKNADALLKNAEKVVVLVSGGYHTAGIKEILNNKRISNITVMPSVAGADTNISKDRYEILARQQKILSEKIALGLISNATEAEQIKAIAGAMFGDRKLDGINIAVLVQQLNDIFSSDIKVINNTEEGTIEFEKADGEIYSIKTEDVVNKEIEQQNMDKMPSGILQEVTGEDLKQITEAVYKTTFGAGQGIFAPQIYEISKEACLFMVNNKWYLGNGAIWDIANSQYSGQPLDGIDAKIYEYMPETMQKAMYDKENNAKKSKGINVSSVKKSVKTVMTRVIGLILLVALMLSFTACSVHKDIPEQTPPSISQSYYDSSVMEFTSQQMEFNSDISSLMTEFYSGNGRYKSFISEKANDKLPSVPAFGDDKYYMNYMENLYDQSLAAMSYMQMGDLEKAEAVLSAINSQEVLYQSNLEKSQKTGEIVWVGIAAVQYKILTGDTSYDSLIEKVDKSLDKVYQRNGGFYYGEVGNNFVSTEHMLDIIAYNNLKTVYDKSDTPKAKIREAVSYLYNTLYNSEKGCFNRGLNDDFMVLDTCTWGVQVLASLKSMNPDIYESTDASKIDLNKLLEYAENNFNANVEYNGVKYHNLYKWAAEGPSPVSFEWTMQLAVTYRMIGNDSRADAILKDVEDYSAALGFEKYNIPYSDQNGVENYYSYGWKVYAVPAICTSVGQRMQIEYGSFYMPIRQVADVDYDVAGHEKAYQLYFSKNEGSNWRTYSAQNTISISHVKTVEIDLKLLNNDISNAQAMVQFLTVDPANHQNLEGTNFGLYFKKYQFNEDGTLKLIVDMEDYLGGDVDAEITRPMMNLDLTKIIIICGETAFDDELNSKKLELDIGNIKLTYSNGETKTYSPSGTAVDTGSTGEKSVPSSILPDSFDNINENIQNNSFSILNSLKEIIKQETLKSMIYPLRFIEEHTTISGQKGAKMLVMTTVFSSFTAFGLSIFLLPLTGLPMILSVLISLIIAGAVNIAAHVLMDYIFLKSTNIEEAVRIFGNDIRLRSDGRLQKVGIDRNIPIFVINNKPADILEYDFKPIQSKFKTSSGERVKGWIGRYKGVPVVYVEGAEYGQIVKQFSRSRNIDSVTGSVSAGIDVIEIDMDSAENKVMYSENGNPLVSVNMIMTNDMADISKEIALLKNKEVESITINQNIAVFIDEPAETVSGSDSMVQTLETYVKGEDLGTEIKILFSDAYISEIINHVRLEVSQDGMSEDEISAAVTEKMRDIIKAAKGDNKEITVVYNNSKAVAGFEKYTEYGIFSYVDMTSGKYVDSITGTETATKMVKDLNSVDGFDGSISVITVSEFKKELEKATGLFTFLNSSLNIRKILENRNIEFVKQVADNFDFNQIPEIDSEVIVSLIKEGNYSYEGIEKYINPSDSIAVYYNGLGSVKERDVFMEGILKRILTVNSLREYEIEEGLKEHKLETLYGQALVAAYINGNDLSGIKADFDTDNMTAADVEFKFMKKITELSIEMKEGKPEAIAGILELIPLYAERNTEFRTTGVEPMKVENIRGILSAA